MSATLMACNADWLDTNASCASGGVELTTTSGFLGQASNLTFYQPWYYPVYASTPARPIKLTLGEVERLRKAAKADDKLKTILQKFTQQIEIAVDFE